MILLHICDNPDVLRVFKLIKIALDLIRWAVPIILIISLMWQYLRVILSQDDELTKANVLMVKKIISAVLVFLIPTIITLLIDISSVSGVVYAKCFTNATDGGIARAYAIQAQEYVKRANKSLNRTDYNKAVSEVSNAKNQIKKLTGGSSIAITSLEKELEALETKVKEHEAQQRKESIDKIRDKMVYPDVSKGPTEFYNAVVGKGYDVDGAWGVQCVDGFKKWCQLNDVPVKATPNGYADGYWRSRDALGYSQYFDYISDSSQFRNGDWVIWSYGSASHPYSHIAMYYNGQEFGQNQGAPGAVFNLIPARFGDALGALRPKKYYK